MAGYSFGNGFSCTTYLRTYAGTQIWEGFYKSPLPTQEMHEVMFETTSRYDDPFVVHSALVEALKRAGVRIKYENP